MLHKIRMLLNRFKDSRFEKNATKKIIDIINKQTKKSMGDKVKYGIVDLVEKYKGIRRLLILIAIIANLYLLYVTVEMYRLTQAVDTQWVIYSGYWAGFLSVAIAFYFKDRSSETCKCIENGVKVGSDAIKDNKPKIATTRNVTVYTNEDDPVFYNNDDFDEDMDIPNIDTEKEEDAD